MGDVAGYFVWLSLVFFLSLGVAYATSGQIVFLSVRWALPLWGWFLSARGSVDFNSEGMRTPLKPFVSGLRLIFFDWFVYAEIELTEILQPGWIFSLFGCGCTDCFWADFEWDWISLRGCIWRLAECLECIDVNWAFELASNNPLSFVRFLISSQSALLWLARLFKITISINSRFFMLALGDATTNSSSNSQGGITNPTVFRNM